MDIYAMSQLWCAGLASRMVEQNPEFRFRNKKHKFEFWFIIQLSLCQDATVSCRCQKNTVETQLNPAYLTHTLFPPSISPAVSRAPDLSI